MVSFNKTAEEIAKVSLDKMKESDKVRLEKHVVSLSKTVVSLSKSKGVDLSGLNAAVAVVLDHSGSMSSDYNHGKVQELLDRLVPLGLQFDDNGELDAYVFSDSTNQTAGITLKNYQNYVKEELEHERWGGTYYSEPIKSILDEYFGAGVVKKGFFGRKVNTYKHSNKPVFVIFITDGDCFDSSKTEELIRQSADYEVFFQFVGIDRGDSFSFLEKLDDLDGRSCDNTGFFKASKLDRVSDEELYEKLIDQFVDWLKVKKFM